MDKEELRKIKQTYKLELAELKKSKRNVISEATSSLLEEDNIYLDRKINFNLISFIKQNNYVKYSLIIIFIGILIYLLKLYLNNRKNIININE